MKLKHLIVAVTAASSLAAGVAVAPASASGVHHPRVSITANHHKLYLGTKVTIAGKVSPNERGHFVHLQRYTHGAWHITSKYKLSNGSQYRFVVKPNRTGTWLYRVYDYPKPGWTATKSNTLHLTVVKKKTRPKTTPPAPAACYPLTNGGNCYEPGEYCRNSDHGASGIAGDGEAITCEDNNGWRWEPA